MSYRAGFTRKSEELLAARGIELSNCGTGANEVSRPRSNTARLLLAASRDTRSTPSPAFSDCNRSLIALEASVIRDLRRLLSVSNRTAANEVLHCESAIEFMCSSQAASGIVWE